MIISSFISFLLYQKVVNKIVVVAVGFFWDSSENPIDDFNARAKRMVLVGDLGSLMRGRTRPDTNAKFILCCRALLFG